MSTWNGIKVKHFDGRTGIIASDYSGFLHRVLTTHVDGGGVDSSVQLNSNGPDTGEAGWLWWCENFCGGSRWLQLGAPHPSQLATGPHDADLAHV